MNAVPTLARPQPEADFLELRYRADLQVLVARWRRPVTPAELRQGYRATLQLAQQAGCPFWQVDIRSRNAPDPATRHWLTAEFLPQAAGCLAGPVYLGYLLTPALQQQMGSPTAGSPQVVFFAEEGLLTNWLTQCQRGQAVLSFRPPLAA